MKLTYFYLSLAIILETIGTSTLKASTQFTKIIPSIISIGSYSAAFYLLSLSLKNIPVGVAYAIWSAAGIVLVTIISAIVYKQIPDMAAIIGFIFIIAGVVIINLFSKISSH
ncbi:QacE family quaternary ammonium compound efflux SMR transporter [Elizabethkingia argentiflava]|uniref:QacE family quaternary ammonium compound efflux SMR transporter n=1 Tax=Elizabethkingia argenteiflava TaxID=2681556 RepID=A0A845PSG0_9FLAO|nr:SMR family transporter [Elizabethkingia argenteiflava]NAW50595.1 QacE family quaternary ammonium compound efflux SMR transporter [Elizabethkingia argenteiflava]